MYVVKADGITIYNDIHLSESYKAINPKLSLKDNAAGSLEITLPPGNAGYDTVERMSSEIVVYRQNLIDGMLVDNEIWSGRVISEQKDFMNNRILTCEGELAYLNDTTQPPKVYENTTVYEFLAELLDQHNYIGGVVGKDRVSPSKRFKIGRVDSIGSSSNDITYRVTNNESTLECITTNLLNVFGGHLIVRKENGVRYLDYVKDLPNINRHTIRFGQNLLDFTRNWDMTQFATVVMPKGAKLETTSKFYDNTIPADLEQNLSVKSENGGSPYVTTKLETDKDGNVTIVTNESAISHYGWLEAVVTWEDVTDPAELLTKARQYLTDMQFNDMVLEVSAVDLRYLDFNAESIKLLDGVRVVSRAHEDGGITLDRVFPVTELSIQLDKPDSGVYTMGSKVVDSFTSSQKTVNQTVLDKVNNIPSKNSILDAARENADKLINQATSGYVTITRKTSDAGVYSEELILSNKNTEKESTGMWKWTEGGLGYYKRVIDGTEWDGPFIALTKDGAISADRITVDTMRADRIRSGVLESDDGNVCWDLSSGGGLTIKNGTIDLGEGKFKVSNSGQIHAEDGKIGGFTIAADNIHNDAFWLDANGLSYKYSNADIGTFGTSYWIDYPSIRGLTMNLEYTGDYVAWMAKDAANVEPYTVKLIYCNKSVGDFTAQRLNFGCDVDGMWWTMHKINISNASISNASISNAGLSNCWFDNGFNQGDTAWFRLQTNIRMEDGVLKWSTWGTVGDDGVWREARVRFQGGFLTVVGYG